jgi:LysM repeat protein
MGSLLMLTGYVTANAGVTKGSGDTADADPLPAAPSTTAVLGSAGAPASTSAAVTTTDTGDIVVEDTTTVVDRCTNVYTVVSGDSWTGIAREASVLVDALYTLNGSRADTVIHPGDAVCLPEGVVVVVTTTQPPTTAAPATTAAPVATAAPVTTAVPARPAAQPASSSKGSS